MHVCKLSSRSQLHGSLSELMPCPVPCSPLCMYLQAGCIKQKQTART